MNIPKELEELKYLKQWVLFKKVKRKDKITKPPLNCFTGLSGDVSNKNEWGYYEDAVRGFNTFIHDTDKGGIGFNLVGDFIAIDLDNCFYNYSGKPKIKKYAKDIIDTLNSYTERSPSGNGIHILIKGRTSSARTEKIEIYQAQEINGKIKGGRYITITGNIYGKPKKIEYRQQELEQVINKYLSSGASSFSETEQTEKTIKDTQGFKNWIDQHSEPETRSDREVLKMAFEKTGDKFINLFINGDCKDYNNDKSRGFLALTQYLIFYTFQNIKQTDRLIRASELFKQDKTNKWDTVHRKDGATYGQMTIEKALNSAQKY